MSTRRRRWPIVVVVLAAALVAGGVLGGAVTLLTQSSGSAGQIRALDGPADPEPSAMVAVSKRYAGPLDMMDKLQAAGFDTTGAGTQPSDRKPIFTVWGALAVPFFHGAATETVYVGVFDGAQVAQNLHSGQPYLAYVDDEHGWYVSAQSQATLDQAVAILSR